MTRSGPRAGRDDGARAPPAPRRSAAPAGERFEDEEKKLFGADGFERVVAEVAAIEKTLGIFDLAQFTARRPR